MLPQVDGNVTTPLKFAQVRLPLACPLAGKEDCAVIHARILACTGSLSHLPFLSDPSPQQAFHLMPNGASWYIHNDMFRLNYG